MRARTCDVDFHASFARAIHSGRTATTALLCIAGEGEVDTCGWVILRDLTVILICTAYDA